MNLLLAAIGTSVILPYAVIQDNGPPACSGTEWRWQYVQGSSIPFQFNNTGQPYAGARTSLTNSLAVWNAVAGSAFTWSDGGDTTLQGFINNGINHVSWNDPDGLLGAGVLGLTGSYVDGSTFDWNGTTWRKIIDTDIVFNDGITLVSNATAGNPAMCDPMTDQAYSVEAIFLHEAGHALGLQHPDQCDPAYVGGYAGAVMYSSIMNCDGTKSVLQADDMNGVSYLYNASVPSVYPSFDADVDVGYSPLDVVFTDTSLGATSWDWDFGDGNTSTQQNPTHTFTGQGAYAVALTIEGSIPAPTRVISVFDPPAVDFDAPQTTGKVPFTISFHNLTTGDVTGYSWDFGDGNSSTEVDPNHEYTSAGTYTVVLTAQGQAGPISTTKADYITIENGKKGNFFQEFLSDMGCECAVSRPMGRAPRAPAVLLAALAGLFVWRRRRKGATRGS